MFVEEDDEYNRILCGYFKKEILHKLSLKKHVLEQSLYCLFSYRRCSGEDPLTQ